MLREQILTSNDRKHNEQLEKKIKSLEEMIDKAEKEEISY